MRSSGQTRTRKLSAALAVVVLATLLALAGCGDDAEETTTSAAGSGADSPTSTNLEPGDQPPTIPELPDNDDPAAVVCTGPTDLTGVFDAGAVVGEEISDAKEQAAKQGCAVRVASRDGEPLALTQDFRPDRVNVAVEDGEVTEIIDIG